MYLFFPSSHTETESAINEFPLQGTQISINYLRFLSCYIESKIPYQWIHFIIFK